MVGSDDVLACFVAGNVFAIESRSRISVPIPVHSANPLDGGWSNLEIKDDSVQPTVEMLLNLAIFIWIGAITPWRQFFDNELIPFGRLVALGVMILLFRRIPVILAMYRFIPQVENIRQAMFMGFFGPIGVSAVFYLYISLEFLERGILVDGKVREDAQQLADTMYIVVWFLIMCSVVSPFRPVDVLFSRAYSYSSFTAFLFPWLNWAAQYSLSLALLPGTNRETSHQAHRRLRYSDRGHLRCLVVLLLPPSASALNDISCRYLDSGVVVDW